MDNTVVAVIITGVVSIGTTLITASKNNALQDERISVIKHELESLNNRVEKHNNFGLKIVELETRISNIEKNQTK